MDMEYCLSAGDGAATMWERGPDLDLDGDGRLDAVGLDFDGDGLADDALADLDGDGIAEHAVLDVGDVGDVSGSGERYFTCGGSAWTASSTPAGRSRTSAPRAATRFGCSTVTATAWPIARSPPAPAARPAMSTPTATAGGTSNSLTPTVTAPPMRRARWRLKRRSLPAAAARYCDGP
jgi:hypothetical protein